LLHSGCSWHSLPAKAFGGINHSVSRSVDRGVYPTNAPGTSHANAEQAGTRTPKRTRRYDASVTYRTCPAKVCSWAGWITPAACKGRISDIQVPEHDFGTRTGRRRTGFS